MEYGIRSCFGKLKRVLMHKPCEELELVTDPKAWGFRARPNWQKASKEFDCLADLLNSEKVKIDFIETESEVPPPNLYFTRDLGVCTTNGFILSYFRHEYRQGEELFLEEIADRLEIPVFGRVRNGYFEGGDVVFLSDKAAAVGIDHRTNKAGYEQVCSFLNEVVVPVMHEHDTHLDSLFAMLDSDLALACKEELSEDFLTFLAGCDVELIPLTKEQQASFATDLILLDSDKVVMGEDCKDVMPLLEDHGVEVIPAQINELKKGCGGPGSFTLTLLRQ